MHRARVYYGHYRAARTYACAGKAMRIAQWLTRTLSKARRTRGRR